MRYKVGLPTLMIYAALRASMIYQACGLDKKSTSRNLSIFLAGAEGKRGHKQFITVLGEAPEENKELKGLRLAIAPHNDYIFEPSENPRVRVQFPLCHFSMKKQKSKPFRLGLFGRGGRTRTHDPWFWRPVLYQTELHPYVQRLLY